MNPIPYGRQHISEKDIESVVEALKSGYLTQGPHINAFESAFAEYVNAEYAVAVSNGTAALHLSVLSLNLNSGDQVITTPITFAASANCIRYSGGEVLFADIDPETYLIDIDQVKSLFEKDIDKKIKGIIPVDFTGHSVDLEAFRILANEHDCWIIEDACHAPGAFFTDSNGKNVKAGSCRFADLSIFSFHPVKHIAAGEGGMITTNDEKLYERLLSLRTHGIVKDNELYINSLEFASGIAEQVGYPSWYMEMQDLGFNYRLTDFQAALGKSQLQRADAGVEKRKEIAVMYSKAFENKSFVKGQSGIVKGHAYHLYVLEVEDRLGLYNHLREQSIYAQIHYIPCHLMPYYRAFGWEEGDMPNAEKYYRNCISLPMFPTLKEDEQRFVIDTIINYYQS